MNKKFRSFNAPLRIKPCGNCQSPDGVFRSQNTAYMDDASNWTTLCDPCQEMADEYWDDWDERWAEYYSGVLV